MGAWRATWFNGVDRGDLLSRPGYSTPREAVLAALDGEGLRRPSKGSQRFRYYGLLGDDSKGVKFRFLTDYNEDCGSVVATVPWQAIIDVDFARDVVIVNSTYGERLKTALLTGVTP